MSTTFSHVFYGSSFSFTGSNITGSASQIAYLAPKILDENSSRYNGYGLTAISAPTSAHNIFLYDYLMVVRLLSSTFSVNVGDVMRFESSVVDGEFVINKIKTYGSYKYVYMYTDFNQNIITD